MTRHTDVPAPLPGGEAARLLSRRGAAVRRWAWAVVLLVGVLLYELCRRAVLETGDPLLLPTLLLIGAAVVPVSFVTFILGRRLVFEVGGLLVGFTALFGGLLAVLAAGTLEYATIRALGGPSLLAVGLIEELAKLLVPAVVLVTVRASRHPADGLLLGVAAGAGFAVYETMGYAFLALVRSRGDLGIVNTVLVDRGVWSPAAHMAWTGLTAAALWWAATATRRGRAVAGFLGVYLLVSVVHASWDAVANGWIRAVLAAVSLGLLLWTTHRLSVHRTPLAVVAPGSAPSRLPSRAHAWGTPRGDLRRAR
jgi:RsiW-degrading membrane proteinase PrsW (M82 family)